LIIAVLAICTLLLVFDPGIGIAAALFAGFVLALVARVTGHHFFFSPPRS
jgi:hypothetical protein